MAPSEEGAGAPKGFRGATEGEITRACCLHRGLDEHQMKRRSFAFSLAYIKCFRTYSVYLSLRLPAQILYAGIHLPPQREARALPRRAQSFQRCVPQLSPPKRAALIRHGAAQKRSTAPPSPRGRLRAPPQSAELHRGAEIRAPSHSVSTEKGSTLSVLPFLRFIYRVPIL